MEQEEFTPFIYTNTRVSYLVQQVFDVANPLQENNEFINKPGYEWISSLPDHISNRVQHPKETTATNTSEFFINSTEIYETIFSLIRDDVKTKYSLRCSSTSIFLGKAELSISLSPYDLFGGRFSASLTSNTVNVHIIRQSNQWKTKYKLDFRYKRFLLVAEDYSKEVIPGPTEYVIGSPEYYKTIRENILTVCSDVADAISEAADCAQLQPRERGSHKICGNCDYQLMCVVRT